VSDDPPQIINYLIISSSYQSLNSCDAKYILWIIFSELFDEQEVQKNSIYIRNIIFCNIITAFTVTFDQLNSSLLNKYWQ